MSSTYVAALRMLARRELSEAQVRQRLARKEHPAEEIDAAIDRLRADRAIDDSRVAEAIARTATAIKRRLSNGSISRVGWSMVAGER